MVKLASVLKALFSWHGRLDRRSFAGAAFGIYLAFFPVDVAGSLAWSALHPAQSDPKLPAALRALTLPPDLAGLVVALAVLLVVLLGLAMLSISIRRLHDMSLSGWCVVAAFVVMALLPRIEVPAPFGSVWQWVWLAALSALRGDAGTNVFGPAPHALASQGTA